MTGLGWLDDKRYRLFHLAVILSVPLLELAANPNALINPGATYSIDAWVYTGFFLSLPSHLQRFGQTYYSTRLSWLLPGFAAHSFLPPLAANYALHLTTFYVLLWVTYRFLARGVDRSTAILGTLFVAWNPLILTAIGWDYVDGVGIVFLMITLFCCERAVQGSRSRWWSAAAGAAATCLVVTNLALLGLLPACAMFVLCRGGWPSLRAVVANGVAGVAGVAAMLIIFGALNRSLGGLWLFLEPQIRFVFTMYVQPNPWRTANYNWHRASWLVLPAFSALGSIASLLATPRERSFSRAIQATSLTAIATWVMLDAFTHTALLQYTYYASYLAPLALVALPLQTGKPQEREHLGAAVSFDLSAYAMLAAAYVAFLWYGSAFWNSLALALNHSRPPNLYSLLAFTAMTIGCLALLSLWVVRWPRLRWSLFVAAVAVSCAGPYFRPAAEMPDGRARFETVVEAHRFIGKYLDRPAIRFWYRLKPQDAPPLRSIASTYLWGWVLINEDLPRLSSDEAATIKPDTRLVFLIAARHELDEGRAELTRLGWRTSIVAEHPFGRDRQSLTVVIADLTRPREGSRP